MILHLENRAAGSVSFYAKVSSESSYDFLNFYIDGSLIDSWSGEMEWSQKVFTLSEGNHDVEWSYIKDGSVTGGSDEAWIDYIEVPPLLSTTANAGADLLICQDETAQLNGFAQNYSDLTWSTSGDGSFSDENILNPIYTPGENDIQNNEVVLSLHVNGINEVSDDLLLSIEICTAINEINQKPNFQVYPNPAQNQFNIYLTDFDGGLLEIISVSGESIYKTSLENQEVFNYSSSALNSGIYFIKISDVKGNYSVQKLLIK